MIGEVFLSFVISFLAGAIITLVWRFIIAKEYFKRLTEKSKHEDEKRFKKEIEAELNLLMENFIEVFNECEKFFTDKELSMRRFHPITQQKGITTEKCLRISIVLNAEISVNSAEELVVFFFISGSSILALYEGYNKVFNFRIEQINNYKDFSERFVKIKKIYNKMMREYEKDIIDEDKYYLSCI